MAKARRALEEDGFELDAGRRACNDWLLRWGGSRQTRVLPPSSSSPSPFFEIQWLSSWLESFLFPISANKQLPRHTWKWSKFCTFNVPRIFQVFTLTYTASKKFFWFHLRSSTHQEYAASKSQPSQIPGFFFIISGTHKKIPFAIGEKGCRSRFEDQSNFFYTLSPRQTSALCVYCMSGLFSAPLSFLFSYAHMSLPHTSFVQCRGKKGEGRKEERKMCPCRIGPKFDDNFSPQKYHISQGFIVCTFCHVYHKVF